MPGEFTDITIRGADEAQSFRRSGGFLEKVFILSSAPPAGWTDMFDQLWEEAEFFPKRHARITNDRLIFVCLEEELTGDPMDRLIDAIAQVNLAYQKRFHI